MFKGIKFPFTEKMIIHSLGGQPDEATIVSRLGDNDFECHYKNTICHAVFNPFTNYFYVDDLYAVIENSNDQSEEDFEI